MEFQEYDYPTQELNLWPPENKIFNQYFLSVSSLHLHE